MENKKRVFAGFHMTPEMDSLVRMYSILQDVPVSQILRANTRDWIEDNSITEEKLIDGLVERIKLDLDKRVISGDRPIQSDFFTEWRTKLEKNLTIPLTDSIILAFRKKHTFKP